MNSPDKIYSVVSYLVRNVEGKTLDAPIPPNDYNDYTIQNSTIFAGPMGAFIIVIWQADKREEKYKVTLFKKGDHVFLRANAPYLPHGTVGIVQNDTTPQHPIAEVKWDDGSGGYYPNIHLVHDPRTLPIA